MENKDSMVLYGSVYRQFERMLKRGMREDALEYIAAIMEYGFDGIIPDENSAVWLYGFDSNMASIDSAAVRYAKAQESGSLGGRARKELDKTEVLAKKEELKTWGAVARYFKVDEKTLRKIRAEWEKPLIPENPKIREKLIPEIPENGKFPEIREDGKNLNVNVNVTENYTENDNEFPLISEKRKQEIQQEIGIDGFVYRTQKHLLAGAEEEELTTLGYTPEEILYIVAELMTEE